MYRSRVDVLKRIDDFLRGTGGSWDWDDFISIPIEDPELDLIRILAAELPDRFPPTVPGHYASEEGKAELRRIAEGLINR